MKRSKNKMYKVSGRNCGIFFPGLVLLALVFFTFSIEKASSPGQEPSVVAQVLTAGINQNSILVLEDEFSFAIGGDMMFGRSINYYFQDEKLPEVMVNLDSSIFRNKNLSMVNLEGPISETPIQPDNTPDNLIFNFPPKTAEVLSSLGINAVSLANNHTLNQGIHGVQSTEKLLKEKNIFPVGSEREFNTDSISHFQSGKLKVAVLAINCLEVSQDITGIIRQEKGAGNFVLVYPHWGDEYENKHSLKQERLAHLWVDNGADLIIGSHPHVVQDCERYLGKPIFYSLGNLLFDQTFSAATQRGLIVSGVITETELKLKLIPTISKKLKPELLEGVDKEKKLAELFEGLGKPNQDTSGYLSFLLI